MPMIIAVGKIQQGTITMTTAEQKYNELVEEAYNELAKRLWLYWLGSYVEVTFDDNSSLFGFLEIQNENFRLSGNLINLSEVDRIDLVNEIGATVTIFDRNN
jgi:hypothetical protein